MTDAEKDGPVKKDEKKENTEPDKKSEEKEQQVKDKEKPKELTKEEIIIILKTFPGIGQVIAERIYDAGINSREKLLGMKVEELKEVRGLGLALAKNLESGIGNAVKEFDEPEQIKKDEEEKKEKPGVTDKALGYLKGTFSKITGFFKGKLPLGKAEKSEPRLSPKEESTPDKEPTPEQSEKDDLYPEVGGVKTKLEKEPTKDIEPVSIEGSDTESSKSILEPVNPSETTVHEPEKIESKQISTSSDLKIKHDQSSVEKSLTKPIIEPELEKINTKDASGLLKWFETTDNLRAETGKMIFKAGYNNLEELKEAVVDDLILIKGIDRKEAELICYELKKL